MSKGSVQLLITTDGMSDILEPEVVFDEGRYIHHTQSVYLQQTLQYLMVNEMQFCNQDVGRRLFRIKNGFPAHDDYSYMLVTAYPPNRRSKKRKRGH